MELYTNFHKIKIFIRIYLPSTVIVRYVRAKMIVHAFMIEIDQPRKINKLGNSMYKVNEELFSCVVTD